MARRPRRIAPLIAIGAFTLLLCLGVIYVYVGSAPFDREPGFELSGTGYVAMAIGLTGAVVLGVGLAALILSGRDRD